MEHRFRGQGLKNAERLEHSMPKQGFRLAFEGKCRLQNEAFYA